MIAWRDDSLNIREIKSQWEDEMWPERHRHRGRYHRFHLPRNADTYLYYEKTPTRLLRRTTAHTTARSADPTVAGNTATSARICELRSAQPGRGTLPPCPRGCTAPPSHTSGAFAHPVTLITVGVASAGILAGLISVPFISKGMKDPETARGPHLTITWGRHRPAWSVPVIAAPLVHL